MILQAHSYRFVAALGACCLTLAGTPGAAQTFSSSSLPIVEVAAARDALRAGAATATTLRIVYAGAGERNLAGGPTQDYEGPAALAVDTSAAGYDYPKADFTLELRGPTGAAAAAPLLGMPAAARWVLRGPYSDKTLVRDVFASTLAAALTQYAPRTRLVELTLGGVYEGVYVLTERIEPGPNRVDIAPFEPTASGGDALSGGYILRFDPVTGGDALPRPTEFFVARAPLPYAELTHLLYDYPAPQSLTDVQRRYIRGEVERFEARLAGPRFSDPVAGYAPLIDRASFVDYLLVSEVTRNAEAYRLSTYLVKDRDSRDPRLHMGPVWGFEHGLANADYCDGDRREGWAFLFNEVCPGYTVDVPFWWQRLTQDSAFRAAVRERYLALRQNGPLADAALTARIDSLVGLVAGGPQERNFERWPILGTYVRPNVFIEEDFGDGVRLMTAWLRDRMAWLDGAIDRLDEVVAVAEAGGGDPTITLAPNPGGATVRWVGAAAGDGPYELRWFTVTGAAVGGQRVSAPGEPLPTPSAPGLYLWEAWRDGQRLGYGRWVRQ